MDNKLYEGCKAMIIGGKTEEGKKLIGKVVEVVQYVPMNTDTPYKGRNFLLLDTDGWIAEGEGLFVRSHAGKVYPGSIGCFEGKYLMPLPPLEDPGIDDCTFTPIKNQEPVAC